MTERPRRWRATLWLVTLIGAAYYPVLAGQYFFFRDPSRSIYPGFWFVRESLRNGESPTWNPRIGLGIPQLVESVSGLFYPPYALAYLLPLPQAATWIWLLHLIVGAIGAARLAARFDAGPSAAAVAGLAFGLSGIATSLWSLGAMLPAASYIPWVALGAFSLSDRIEDRWPRRLGGIARGAAPIALSLLVGEVFVTFIACGLALALVAIRGLPRARLLRTIAGQAVAGALALMVAAPAWLPAAAGVGRSERSAPPSAIVAETWSMHPLSTLDLAAPAALGEPYRSSPATPLVMDARQGTRGLQSYYLGASVLALALLGLGRERRQGILLTALALATLLLAYGRFTPVHGLFRSLVRPLAYMRYPEKYLLVVMIVVCILAARGVQRLLDDERPSPRLMLPLGALAIALGTTALAAPAAWRAMLIPPVLRAGALVLLVIGVLLARRRIGPGAIGVCVVVLVAVDLATAAWPAFAFGPADLVTEPPAAAHHLSKDARARGLTSRPRFVRDDRIDRLDDVPIRALEDFEQRAMGTLAPNTPITFGIDMVSGTSVALSPQLAALMKAGGDDPAAMLRLLGVDYYLQYTPRPEVIPPKGALEWLGDPLPRSRIFRVTQPLPRVYAVAHAEPMPARASWSALLAPAVVEGRRVLLGPRAAPLAGPDERAGSCALVRHGNTTVEAECTLQSPAVVVFVEQYDPGWTARLDGAPVPIEAANGIMRAVRCPPGQHRIALAYHAPHLGTALVMAVAGALLMLGALVVERRRPV